MMIHTITPSLYSAWHFWNNATEDYQDKALSEFLCALTKTKNPPTALMQQGLDYEEKIQAMSERERLGISYNDNDPTPIVDRDIANMLQNCIWQVPVKQIIMLPNGLPILLKGRIDAFDPTTDTIYDLKFTSRPFSQGMYYSSIQHLLYMNCLDVPNFRYIIRNKNNNTEFFTDDYYHLPVNTLLTERIQNFLVSLQTEYPKYFNEYEKWWKCETS